MTLNEERDKLAAEFPGHTISVGAESWYHYYMDGSGEGTLRFNASLHKAGKLVAGSFTKVKLADAISEVRAKMGKKMESVPADIEVAEKGE